MYGRQFTIMTDHKPLLGIFGDSKPASPMASARLAHWYMILSAYSYDLIHREGKMHQNADGLSRLPVEEKTWEWSHPNLAELEMEPAAPNNILVDVDTRPVDAEEVKKMHPEGSSPVESEALHSGRMARSQELATRVWFFHSKKRRTNCRG